MVGSLICNNSYAKIEQYYTLQRKHLLQVIFQNWQFLNLHVMYLSKITLSGTLRMCDGLYEGLVGSLHCVMVHISSQLTPLINCFGNRTEHVIKSQTFYYQISDKYDGKL